MKKTLCLLLSAVLLFSCAGCSPAALFKKSIMRPSRLTFATEQNERYLTTYTGKTMALGENETAITTPDQSRAVLYDKQEKTLRVVTVGSGKSKTVSLGENTLIASGTCLTDKTALLSVKTPEEKYELWIYSFKKGDVICRLSTIPKNSYRAESYGYGLVSRNYASSGTTYAFCYTDDERRTLYSYTEGETEHKQIYQAAEDVVVLPASISDNGRSVMWIEYDKNAEVIDMMFVDCRIMMNYKGKTTEIASLTKATTTLFPFSTADGELVVFTKEKKLYQIRKGKLTVSDFDYQQERDFLYDGAFYSEEGPLNEQQKPGDHLYFHSEAGIWHFDKKGNGTKLLDNVTVCNIRGGSILYLQNGTVVRAAKLKGAALKKEYTLKENDNGYRIDATLWTLLYRLSDNGAYCYYRESGKLYGYKIGAKEPCLIDENGGVCSISADGRTVVYESKIERDGQKITQLKQCRYGSKKPVVIAENAYSWLTGNSRDTVTGDFLYLVNTDDTYKTFNVYRWNGHKGTVIFENVKAEQ